MLLIKRWSFYKLTFMLKSISKMALQEANNGGVR